MQSSVPGARGIPLLASYDQDHGGNQPMRGVVTEWRGLGVAAFDGGGTTRCPLQVAGPEGRPQTAGCPSDFESPVSRTS